MSPEQRDIRGLRRLPYLLVGQEVADLTGFLAHEIPIISGEHSFVPIGNPGPQDKKRYLTADVIRFAEDRTKMAKAVKTIRAYWKRKNASRRSLSGATRNGVNAESSDKNHND